MVFNSERSEFSYPNYEFGKERLGVKGDEIASGKAAMKSTLATQTHTLLIVIRGDIIARYRGSIILEIFSSCFQEFPF